MMDGVEFIEAEASYPDCPTQMLKDYFAALHWSPDHMFVTDKKEFWENQEKSNFIEIPIKEFIPVGVVESIMIKAGLSWCKAMFIGERTLRITPISNHELAEQSNLMRLMGEQSFKEIKIDQEQTEGGFYAALI